MTLTIDLKPSSTPRSVEEREALKAVGGFGQIFTDHMVTIHYTEGRGWHDAALEPYGPVSLDPAASVLHYGQEIFEGLKASAPPTAQIVSFRPEANAARFNRSARPDGDARLPEDLFLGPSTRWSGGPRWVPERRGPQPVPAAVHVRHACRPRRELAEQLPVHADRPPAGSYFAGGVER